MNLCRCERGHFYDKEKYSTCPHCSGPGADAGPTQAFVDDKTVPIEGGNGFGVQDVGPTQGWGTQAVTTDVGPTQGWGTQGVQDPNGFIQQPTVDATMPLGSQMGNPQVIQQFPVDNGFPISNQNSNEETIGSQNGGDLTENLDSVMGKNEDDDCTIGFYDDYFTQTQPIPSTPSVIPVSKPSEKKGTKVSTPCVGWLVAVSGENIGVDFHLKVGKNFIGRGANMDVALTDDKSVSRDRHAIVVYEPKARVFLVQPGESSSLAYRNGEVILTPVKLNAYDIITVGEVNLLFIPLCGAQFNWEEFLKQMKKTEN